MKHLFSRLVSYAPREGRDAKEDFFTELFAHILQNDKTILAKFLKLLEADITNPIIYTQYSLDKENEKQRADILLKDQLSDESIIIESKIHASFEPDQIKGYLKIIKDKKDSKVVSITNEDSKELGTFKENHKEEKKFKHLYWFQIYKILKVALKESREENKYILNETIKFMEDENMAEFEGFDDENIGAWSSFMRLDKKMTVFINQHLKAIVKNEGYTILGSKGSGDAYAGFYFNGGKTTKGCGWVGFHYLDLEQDGNSRIYCAIQLCNINEKDSERIMKKSSIFGKIKETMGLWYYQSVPYLVGNVKKDQQQEKLKNFFKEGLKAIKKNNLLDYTNTS